MTQEDRLKKINSLSFDDVYSYLQATHRSILTSNEKIELIEACENRLKRLNRNSSLIEEPEIKLDEND